jgi:hypothetical protein
MTANPNFISEVGRKFKTSDTILVICRSGKRFKNGWRNSGAPWTDKLDPQLIWIPSDP